MILNQTRPLLLLLDVETSIVLGTVPTVACGQMLMLGLLNTQLSHLPLQVYHLRERWDGYDFNAEQQLYTMSRGWTMTPAPAALVTPQIHERRRLMRQRISYLHPWEIYCQGALVRFNGYMSDGVQAFVRSELTAGAASTYVQEYASIHDISVENALQELHGKVRSLGMVAARNWAQYEKIAQGMAMARDRDEQELLMKQGFDILYNNAYI
ncbi:hypothetical protein SAMN05192549_105170 [Duganella sacchari]|uniref:Uncharacterized protein n=1 Tax=Duganella sacchari TaxID=551987 RepID=A0A1M7PKK5_9BURK|nr:hypothetical protein [Duganella sacchari]SHN17689.1 hypothetical protein SAMN05192549_105170 [Duganella sacchari]